MSLLANNLPDQRLLIGTATSSVSRATLSRSESYMAPIGFAANYGIYLSDSLMLDGGMSLTLDSVEGGIFLLGGSAGLQYHLLGGRPIEYNDLYLDISSYSKFNILAGIGLSAGSYNFAAYDRASAVSGTIITPDQKDQQQGAFFALYTSIAIDYAQSKSFSPGIKLTFKSAFSDDTSPDLTFMDISLYGAFNL